MLRLVNKKRLRAPFCWTLACITGALRAKRGERGRLRAKCRVRLAWLLKRLLCRLVEHWLISVLGFRRLKGAGRWGGIMLILKYCGGSILASVWIYVIFLSFSTSVLKNNKKVKNISSSWHLYSWQKKVVSPIISYTPTSVIIVRSEIAYDVGSEGLNFI